MSTLSIFLFGFSAGTATMTLLIALLAWLDSFALRGCCPTSPRRPHKLSCATKKGGAR